MPEHEIPAPTGFFLSFEGSEGCGKSTQIKLLSDRLQAEGREVLLTREPGGTALGERLRELIQFTPEVADMCDESELLLFTASRAQLVRARLLPAIAAGTVVIADRFFDSTTVYQGMARGLDRLAVDAINGFAVGECRPHLTLLLDLDAEEGRRRAASREGATDRMEQQADEFYQKVRNGYLELASAEPERICVIDASGSIDEVAGVIWNIVQERIAL